MATHGQYQPAVNCDKVIEAVTRGYGKITDLQTILQQLPHGNPWTELARHLSQEAADALFGALCLLQSAGKSPGEHSGDPMQVAATSMLSHSYDAKDPEIPMYHPFVRESSNPKAKRCDAELFRTVTVWPDYVDQYQWRKYGQKKIRGTNFQRSYYRCTYFSDQGCSATKRVQQLDRDDPPKFLVTYFSEHTCNSGNQMATNLQDTNVLHGNLKGDMLCFNSAYSDMKKEQVVSPGSCTDHAFDSWMILDSTGGLIGNKDETAASSSMVGNYYSSSELTSISSVACTDQETSYDAIYPFSILDGMDMICREDMEFVEFDAFDAKPF